MSEQGERKMDVYQLERILADTPHPDTEREFKQRFSALSLNGQFYFMSVNERKIGRRNYFEKPFLEFVDNIIKAGAEGKNLILEEGTWKSPEVKLSHAVYFAMGKLNFESEPFKELLGVMADLVGYAILPRPDRPIPSSQGAASGPSLGKGH